jgi:hypothetical protein
MKRETIPLKKGSHMDFKEGLRGGRERHLPPGADIFSPVTHACPLWDFATLNLLPGIFDQPAQNGSFNTLSVYYNRSTRSALR